MAEENVYFEEQPEDEGIARREREAEERRRPAGEPEAGRGG